MSKKRQNPRNVLEFILITIAIVLVVAVLKYMDDLHAYTSDIQTYTLQTNITGIGNFNGLLQ
jgi:hypothetical protein